ncbi:molybdenum cofactor guanylyltransferase [Algoriphagus sp.]|uniref:molybdenum cofactor guanylyltransferase n=1 Tax=Algoriphagus sp. TaxID=1872435 RepID=UPI0025E5A190|nr:molybdenum cofactor guanylyltransferase [Algoriphagus sp.]
MENVNQNIAVYILCGGRSSRMKSEKGLVEFKGKAFLQWILEAVYPLSDKITLVTKNDKYSKFQLPIIHDLVDNKGPVGGIYTALSDSNSKYNLILSCDIPKITTEVLNDLIQLAFNSEKEISILSDETHDYPLIGCYQKKLFPIFQNAVFQNHLKLCALVDSLSPQKFQVIRKNQSAVQNINSLEDLYSLQIQSW